jgi:hypothetical protein
MGPAGGGIQGGRFGRPGHKPKGPPTRSAPKRALLRTEARFLAPKTSAGMKEPWATLAGPRRPLPGPRGPRENNRHARPTEARAPPTPAAALKGHKAATRSLWGRFETYLAGPVRGRPMPPPLPPPKKNSKARQPEHSSITPNQGPINLGDTQATGHLPMSTQGASGEVMTPGPAGPLSGWSAGWRAGLVQTRALRTV